MKEPRPGKRVWRGALVCDVEGEPVRMIVEVVERATRADGQVLLLPEVEVQAWWTSRLMGQAMLGAPAVPLRQARQRRRIRTVIQNLIYLAARLVVHARQVRLRYGRGNRWGPPLLRIWEALA